MFLLSVIEEKLKILPEQFHTDSKIVLIEQIEQKYANKILTEVGLGICFYDFLEVGDPYVYPAEGCAHQLVRFRMVFFRPFVGETLVGKVLSSNEEGIRVSLEFFEDILIPSYHLHSPAEYKDGLWAWNYGDSPDSGFVFRLGATIRVKVRSINFTKYTSTAKGVEATTVSEFHSTQNSSSDGLHRSSNVDSADSAEPGLIRRRSSSITNEDIHTVPMQVICSANEDGLGLVEWWQ